MVDEDKIIQKKKHRTLTRLEDPLLYHAKPKDLDLIPQQGVKSIEGQDISKENLFSRTPFSKINGISNKLVDILEKSESNGGFGVQSCTRIQSVVLPYISATSNHQHHQNYMIKSQTGSGKTLAYCIPMINDLMNNSDAAKRSEGTRALIIAPTRELCGQIANVLIKLTQCCVWLVSGSITGGEKRKSEKARLRKGMVILVATPGRLLDHLKATESFNLKNLKWIIMDEADRLLDMGFEQTVLEILSIIRGESLTEPNNKSNNSNNNNNNSYRHNLTLKWTHQNAVLAKRCQNTNGLIYVMASATLSKSVKQLTISILKLGSSFTLIDGDTQKVININGVNQLNNLDNSNNEVIINDDMDTKIDEKNKNNAPLQIEKDEIIDVPSSLSQYFMIVSCKWRLAALLSFIQTHSHQKIMIFFSTCDSVDYHSLLFRESEWPLDLDNPLPQSQENNDNGISLETAKNSTGKEKWRFNTNNNEDDIYPNKSRFTGIFGKQTVLYRLHGNIPQKIRSEVYKDFCNAKSGIMLCTDVAARGLDLPKVDWILQYDPPCDTIDYIHRIGRTARKGLIGSALLFLLPSEASYIQLLSTHKILPTPLSLQSLFMETSKLIPMTSKFKNMDEMTAVILQRRMETVIYKNKPLLLAAKQTFRSFVRAYATHSSDTKGIFKVQSLHLGHVAKSFGLRESPSELRCNDDVIGKIFNGYYMSHNSNNNNGYNNINNNNNNNNNNKIVANNNNNNNNNNNKNSKIIANINNNNNNNNKENSLIGKKRKNRDGGVTDTQKLRKMGSSLSSSSLPVGGGGGVSKLSPSGKFRKSSGYFRKKIRMQSSSEFSSK
eukprot:gene8178-11064_t